MHRSLKFLVLVLILQTVTCFGVGVRESVCLNGMWDFKLVYPKSDQGWGKIAVPGHISLQGFNQPYWYLTEQENSIYKREISVPEHWEGKRVFLRFEGVFYKATVFINDVQLGVHESGYTAFEYEITELVGAGDKAELRVEIDSKGKYFRYDNMDYWVLTGIYRDVKLIGRPMGYIENWKCSTDWPEKEGGQATLFLDGKIRGVSGGKVAAMLELDGKEVAGDEFEIEDGEFGGELKIDKPLGWSAETPVLYDLSLSLLDGGDEVDNIGAEVGLREITIEKGMLCINNKPVTFRGVARHDLWPEVGRALTDEMSRKDIVMMKKAGVNAVRTSHHTCEPSFVKWADRLGLYIFDNISMSNIPKKLQDDPNAREATVLRTDETVLRDRNNPSVIVWLMGNEIHTVSYQHQQMYKRIQELDGSRPTQMPAYCSDEEYPEFVSQHYPGPAGFLWKALDHYNKPMLSTEYLHSAYEGCGRLAEIWDMFDASMNCTGGTIWEWMDQGILHDRVGGWEAKWPDKVTIYPGSDEKQEVPCGFGAINLKTPDTIELVFDAEKGEYVFEISLLGTKNSNRVGVSCDGTFVGVYKTTNEARDFKFPVTVYGDGEHKIVMKWDYVGGGHNFDCIKLVGNDGEVVWQLGKKDGSCEEFAKEPAVKRLAEKRLDTALNGGADGFTYADRSPQDQFYNVKAVYAPVKVSEKSYDAARNKWYLRLKNRLSFTDLVEHKSKFVVQFYDGHKTWTKSFKGPRVDLEALASKDIVVDMGFIAKNRKHISAVQWQILPGGEYDPDVLGSVWLNLCEVCPDLYKEAKGREIETCVDGDIVAVDAGNKRLIFDKSKGALSRYLVDGEDVLAAEVKVGIWRPTLEYEQKLLYGIAALDWGGKFKEYLDSEYDGEAVRKPVHMKYEMAGDVFVVKFLNQYVLKNTGENIMKGFETYEVSAEGKVNLKGCWLWQGGERHLRRIGFDFILDSRFDEYTFSGRGPLRSFVNCKLGFDNCVHQLGRDDKNAVSNKTGCYWLKWSMNDNKSGIIIDPGWVADIEASVSESVTYQRVSRARGCGNKYGFPGIEDQIWPDNPTGIQMEIDFVGF